MAIRGKPRTKRTAKKSERRIVHVPDTLTHSDADKARALKCYHERHTVSGACAAAGIGRTTWYEWINTDPQFARAVADAEEQVADELEEEAHKRAKGSEGSDTLLIFLLKTLRRHKFGDRQIMTIVSQEVRDRLVRQADVIVLHLGAEQAEPLLMKLDEIWR